ncbi:MAG: hypothetical protein Q4P36_06165 [Bowdeniella nasicola]|nr:hypothetical protein [Bowdeniella nasicola]
MYGALWRLLPGPTWVRVILALLIALAVVFVLFEYVFPVIEPYMPFQQGGLDVG